MKQRVIEKYKMLLAIGTACSLPIFYVQAAACGTESDIDSDADIVYICEDSTTVCSTPDTFIDYKVSYQQWDDFDGDGRIDSEDNCMKAANSEQWDDDRDGVGDACDNCPYVANPDQRDIDEDGLGNPCDDDDDGDGVVDRRDNCPEIYNPDQECIRPPEMDSGVEDGGAPQDDAGAQDMDSDCICEGEMPDLDRDDDGVVNLRDNCPDVFNPEQEDEDRDGLGDACDDSYCFEVASLLDQHGGGCLDPNEEFVVDTPDVANARTEQPLMLRLFANRVPMIAFPGTLKQPSITYRFYLVGRSNSEDVKIENGAGATAHSEAFEYRYFAGSEPTFTSNLSGMYTIGLRASVEICDYPWESDSKLADIPAASEAVCQTEYAETTAKIRVSGGSNATSDDCDCAYVGHRREAFASSLFIVFLLAWALVRGRRR